MKKEEIALDHGYGPSRRTTATIYGPFGVHLGNNGRYVVTHVPTGRAATFDATSEAAGLRLARRLVRLPVRWSFTDLKKFPKRSAGIALACVRKWEAEERKPA